MTEGASEQEARVLDDDDLFDEEWEVAWAQEIDRRCLEIELIEAESPDPETFRWRIAEVLGAFTRRRR